jgi:hypothetical protein
VRELVRAGGERVIEAVDKCNEREVEVAVTAETTVDKTVWVGVEFVLTCCGRR